MRVPMRFSGSIVEKHLAIREASQVKEQTEIITVNAQYQKPQPGRFDNLNDHPIQLGIFSFFALFLLSVASTAKRTG